MSAKCSRGVWETMAGAIDTLRNDTDRWGWFVSAENAEMSGVIVGSQLEEAMLGPIEAYDCRDCFVNKYKSLYPFYKDEVVACMDGITDECRAFLNEVETEFEYCEHLLVEPVERCSYIVAEQIGDLFTIGSAIDGIKDPTTEAAYLAELRRVAGVSISGVLTMPCWTCFEALALGRYAFRQSKAQYCLPHASAAGCVDPNTDVAAAAACLNKVVSPPQAVCDSRSEYALMTAVSLATDNTAFAGAPSKQRAMAEVLSRVSKDWTLGVGNPRSFACYSCYEDYLPGYYEELSMPDSICGSPPTQGCIDPFAQHAVLQACLTASRGQRVKNMCPESGSRELADAGWAHDFKSDLALHNGNPTEAVVGFFHSSAFMVQHPVAANPGCFTCIQYLHSQMLALGAPDECKAAVPPLSCAEAVLTNSTIAAQYHSCLAGTWSSHAVTNPSLFFGLILVAFVNLFL